MLRIMLALLCAMSLHWLHAQAPIQQDFKLGTSVTFQSSTLNEQRTLNIYTPIGWNADQSSKLPVIYLLDGSANEDFIHVVGLVQFFNMLGLMPPSLVVGIANVDRRRDFTYPSTLDIDRKDFPTSGGSTRFIEFLQKEVKPYITSNFPTDTTQQILIGQSLGGLLATEVLLKHTPLFSHYIIVSPSMWWDAGKLLDQAPAFLHKQAQTNARVFLTVGTEGKEMEGSAQRLNSILRKYAKHWKTSFVPLPQENHATILHQAVYKALGIFYPKPPQTKQH